MSLYDSIMEHESGAGELVIELVVEKRPDLKEGVMAVKDKIVEANINRLRLILREAQKNPGSPLGEEQLQAILRDMDAMNIEQSGIVITDPDILKNRREWVSAYFKRYQQLMVYGGRAVTYEQAARMAFPDRDSHKQSLQAITDSEKKIISRALAKGARYPLNAFIKAQAEAGDMIEKIELDYFFPEE